MQSNIALFDIDPFSSQVQWFYLFRIVSYLPVTTRRNTWRRSPDSTLCHGLVLLLQKTLAILVMASLLPYI